MIEEPTSHRPEVFMDRKLDRQGIVILLIGWLVALYTTLT
jgi:hypothetical protein